MSDLTIVMYHYVRPIAGSRFPGIKGLELEGFERQLDFLEENYHVVNTEQVISAVTQGKNLPPDACWLTFDDGYKDHYDFVLPLLLRRNLTGAFFPPKTAIEDNVMLDVNSIHHILSVTDNIHELVNRLKTLCLSHGISNDQINAFYKEYAAPNRYDDGETIFVKRMLQHVLPEQIRSSITGLLFHEYVGVTESQFSGKLYMSMYEVRALVNKGMYVGSHGSMHYWLDKISVEQQRKDIVDSLNFLENAGAPTDQWIMCYPYGSYSDSTLSLINELGASIGITTDVRKANLSIDNPLTLPRFDTNDFPQ